MYESLSLYIDGVFLRGEGRGGQSVEDPATGESLGWLPHAHPEDLARALQGASRALPAWKAESPLVRGQILRRVAELSRTHAPAVARNITLDEGKPVAEAVAEVQRGADHLDWHAEECRRIYGRVVPPRRPDVRQLVLREPVGVCAAFTPWNFPYGQAIRKIAAALGAGCTASTPPDAVDARPGWSTRRSRYSGAPPMPRTVTCASLATKA